MAQCWFCGQRPASPRAVVFVEVSGVGEQLDIEVPRCASCSRWQLANAVYSPFFVLFMILMVPVMLIFGTAAIAGERGMVQGAIIAGVPFVGSILLKLSIRRRLVGGGLDRYQSYPEVRALPQGARASLPGQRRLVLFLGGLLLIFACVTLYFGLETRGYEPDKTYEVRNKRGNSVGMKSGAELERGRRWNVVILGGVSLAAGAGLTLVGIRPGRRHRRKT